MARNFGTPNGGLANLKAIAKHGDFAFFPGTGPSASCGMCSYYDASMFPAGSQRGKCRKAAELRTASIRTIKPIPGSTASCKYFVGKKSILDGGN